jgi:hypothetical protein
VKLSHLTPKDPRPEEQEWEKVIDPDGIGAVDLVPAEIDDKRLRQLFDHWDNARQGRDWLARADFRPELCPLALPHVALIERRHEALSSFYIRLTGEKIANPAFGFVKGGYVERLAPAWYRDHLLTTCRAAFAQGEVAYQLVRAVYDGRVILYRRLVLPVTRHGDTVDLLLIASVRTRRLPDFIAAGRALG